MHNPLLISASCVFKSAWNAWTCPAEHNRYVALQFDNQSDTPNEIAPVWLERGHDSSTRHDMYGIPHDGPGVPNMTFRALVPLGHDYSYTFSGEIAGHVRVQMQDAAPGDFLLVSLPFPGITPHLLPGLLDQ